MADTSRPEKYELDDDGYPREVVGPWVKDKHIRLEKYVGISRSVRSKFIGRDKAGATFIDLYSGPGRMRIREEAHGIDGSPLVAWRESVSGGAPFAQIHVADTDKQMSAAVEARLRKLDAPVDSETGPAAETIDCPRFGSNLRLADGAL